MIEYENIEKVPVTDYIMIKGVKRFICPICGNDIFISTSRYDCQYCHTPLEWPPRNNKKCPKNK